MKLLAVVVLSLGLTTLGGCAADAGQDDAVDEGAASADALTSVVDDGSAATTTANLRLREAPSTSAATIRVLSSGTTVTIVDGTPQNGFYKVSADGDEGYCSGSYLKLASSGSSSTGSAPSTGNGGPGQATGETFVTTGTGYYPDSSALEGGFVDRRGTKLHTLQDFLAGNADYVSVAMDTHAFTYGQKLRIREIEVKYNKVIEFRVVDTGGAFTGKGRSRMDICVANKTASYDATINGSLHVTIE